MQVRLWLGTVAIAGLLLLCSAPVVLAALGDGLRVLAVGGAVALVLLGAGGGLGLLTLAQGEAQTRRARALGQGRQLPGPSEYTIIDVQKGGQ